MSPSWYSSKYAHTDTLVYNQTIDKTRPSEASEVKRMKFVEWFKEICCENNILDKVLFDEPYVRLHLAAENINTPPPKKKKSYTITSIHE